jgi:MFS family permease
MNPWKGLQGLPREVWVLFVSTLINRMGTMVLPFLALYLTSTLGFPPARAGVVLAMYGIGALLTGPVSGKLSDRMGHLRMMQLSLFFSGVVIALIPLATSMALVCCIILLWSVVSEAFRPASLAIITGLVPPAQRKTAFAVNRLAINLGMSVGPALGGFLFVVSYHSLFWVDSATTVLACAILVFARWNNPEEGTGHPAPVHPLPERRPAYRDARLIYFLVVLIPVVIVFFQHEASLPIYLTEDLKLAASTYGLLFTINTVLIIFIEIPLNIAMARWSHGRTLALGALLVGAGFGAMAFATDLPGVIGTVVLWTFGEMILLPGAANYMGDLASREQRGEYMGLYQMTFSFAFAISAWIGTTVLDMFGGVPLWLSTLGAGIVSAVLLYRVRQTSS